MSILQTSALALTLVGSVWAQEPMPHAHPAMPMQMQHSSRGGEFACGTSWQPLSSPQYLWMAAAGSWNLMFHGELFLEYDQQGDPGGVGKAASTNRLMMMQDHKVGRGSVEFREMPSAEPLTIPHPGLPTLFQTGETYHGQPLVDYQHPHDVWGELALRFSYPLSERLSWFLYGGPAGEPALGPTAFIHRISAAENPPPPLGHHLQDSTHISYGVVTTGFIAGLLKLEGSAFNRSGTG